MNLKINNFFSKKDIFAQRQAGVSSYGALSGGQSFGVGHGPIKISHKINIGGSTNKKNPGSTAKKSHNTQQTQGTSSSKKMKISKSYIGQVPSSDIQNLKSLSSTYQQRLAEQRAKNASHQHIKTNLQRNVSCSSHNQTKVNPHEKQHSYISGKPKMNMGAYVYSHHQDLSKDGGHSGGATDIAGRFSSGPGRSALSIKNAHEVIKRKNSFANGNTSLPST